MNDVDMFIVDIGEHFFEIAGALIASITVLSYFVSTWFSSAASSYYRIWPPFCRATLSRTVMFISSGVISICVISYFVAYAGSIPAIAMPLGWCILLILVFVAFYLNKEIGPILIMWLVIGIIVFGYLTINVQDGHLLITGNILFRLGSFYFSITELVILIVELRAVFYLAGLIEVMWRKDFLVDDNNGEIMLELYFGDRCAIGKIDYIEKTEDGKLVCHLGSERIYGTLSDPKRVMHWCRFDELVLDRSNADEKSLLRKLSK